MDLAKLLGIPLFLMIAVWGVFKTFLDASASLNRVRNEVLMSEPSKERRASDLRRLMLWSDWFPLWVGFTLFLVLFVAILAMVPTVARQLVTDDPFKSAMVSPVFSLFGIGLGHIDIACYGLAAVGMLSVLGNAIGGLADLMAMRRFLQAEPGRSRSQQTS
jgi:hypothetical protein